MLHNNYQNLEELRDSGSKCPRCSLCKFPPLVQVKSQEFSSICPSYEAFGFHAYAGGGHVVTAMSLLDARGPISETVKKIAWACTACGGCDMACKYSSDIEVQEIILMLRNYLFEQNASYPEHRAVLDSIRADDTPFAKWVGKDLWRRSAETKERADADMIILVGRRHTDLSENHPRLTRIFALLNRAGVRYRLFAGREPYAGRAAYEIGDRALAHVLSVRMAEAIAASGAKTVLCLEAEDYAMLRQVTPRFAAISARVIHLVELYAELLQRGKLRPQEISATVTYHDSSWLGRLSEPFLPWEGHTEKLYGQLLINHPKRPVVRGTSGCYQPPREVIGQIPGLQLHEMERRCEYAYDSGETGQAQTVFPEFALDTARRRLAEAKATGARYLATACPASHTLLHTAAGDDPSLPTVTTVTDLLYQSAIEQGGTL